MNAEIIKTALMSYYRFKRQMICVDEAYCNSGLSDVLVESKNGFYDIEVKINKYDLWKGEATKKKHLNNIKTYLQTNYFCICVPTELLEEAKKWVEQTNPKYGILEFDSAYYERYKTRRSNRFLELCINTIKTPQKLTEEKSKRLHEILIKRLSSAYINYRQKHLTNPE
jgi:hypothetical protein